MSLRRSFNRFCFNNRNKGIPNLMLYIALGNAIVLILSMVNGGSVLYELLCFDKGKILQGQVWRLVSYVFTQSGGGIIDLLFLYFFYMLGRHVETSMGTFKFNLFYFSGVVLMDIFAMLFCPVLSTDYMLLGESFAYFINAISIYSQMAYYLHLSLILTFATLYPESRFMIFFIIPVKAWLIALIYLILEAVAIFNLSYPVLYFPHNLFPLVALANYFLFTGSEIKNLLPRSWLVKIKKKKSNKTGTIPFEPATPPYQKTNTPYNHRCTVCGRTDVSNPELEFRYCSRCNGYHCYCEDHISNHEHIE
ncbi:MAG: rhomboid family intramembrane serine protease [Ruminococcaceae bacterium]|nr:rhomboid family intramembrane serine protease [Oscillospiraceae bacterium]